MKPPYSYYTDRMWRYFLDRRQREQNGTISADDLRPVEQQNYSVCLELWNEMSAAEECIVNAMSRSDQGYANRLMAQAAEYTGIPISEAWSKAHAISRKTAIKRGLISP